MRYQQKNSVWLFERHKPSARPNTIISIKVMAVTSKHSDHDTEQACFVICTLLEWLRHRKVHCTPWSLLNTQHSPNVRAVWTVGTPGGCPVNVVTKLITPQLLGRMSATWSYRKSTMYDRTSCTKYLYCSNSGKTFYTVSRTDSIALVRTVLPSILSQMNPSLRWVLILFL